MKHTISYHIRYLLREEGQIYVPGIGMFRLDYKSAIIDTNRQSILPPTLDLNFTDGTSSDSHLVESITLNENLDKEIIKKEVSNFTDFLVKKLVDEKKVELKGLGTLYNRDGRVTFLSSSNSIKPEYDWLNAIKLNPVNRFKKAHAAINIIPKETLKIDYNPILLGFVGGLFLIGLFTIFGWLTSSDISSVVDDSSTITEETIISDTIAVTNNEYIVNPFGQQIPSSAQCIIITASLSKFKNVIEMEALLYDKGYTVYSENYHEMTRVGVVFDCMEVDLVDYIQNVRSDIAAEAWYLDPELEVKY